MGEKLKEGIEAGGTRVNAVGGLSEVVPMREMGEVTVASGTLVEESSPSRYDLRVLQALRRIIRGVDLYSRKLAAQHKITGPQLVCLLAVEEHEPVTVSRIARIVHLSPSTVIGILDRLAAKGLIRRERGLKDRRLVEVSLTEQGRRVAASAPSPLQDTLVEALNEVPEVELAMIAGVLERIVEMMEVRHIDAAPMLATDPIVPVTEGGDQGMEPSGGEPPPS